jgi:ATP-binding cassette subfamily B multidrug efflux pump
VAATGIWLWLNGLMTPGALAVSLGLVMRFQGMSQWVMWEMSSLFENIGTVRDGIASLSVSRVVSDEPDAKALPEVKGDIKFDHVSFHYGKKAGVIDDLNLHIHPGEKIGLVGRSGAGKSTIVNLLLRFYDRAEGQILVDGHDIAKVTQDSLRANIGVVTQDTSLLHRSVRDNILYGRPDATEDELLEAARATFVDRFVHSLPDGYDTVVDEDGGNLSAGERQLLTIARAFLADPALLILDEATSSVDTRTELLLQHAMAALRTDRTSFVIAHRLSTIRDADLILVMEDGKIVEQGDHESLLASGGAYARLYQSQFAAAVA